MRFFSNINTLILNKKTLDFDGRKTGFDIQRLDMASQTITLFGYFSFQVNQEVFLHKFFGCFSACFSVFFMGFVTFITRNVHFWQLPTIDHVRNPKHSTKTNKYLSMVYWSVFSVDSFPADVQEEEGRSILILSLIDPTIYVLSIMCWYPDFMWLVLFHLTAPWRTLGTPDGPMTEL